MAASSKFSIAVHILACLEYSERQCGEGQMNSDDLAISVNANPVIIRTLLSELRKFKLVISKEGKGGGTRLARPASKISLDSVYEAVERPSVLAVNPRAEHKPCTVSCGIKNALAPVLNNVDTAVVASLKKITLAEIVNRIMEDK